uniref:Cytochrome b6-f complex subunit 7 n=1 Tax=Eustigmatophyceae sp. Chic 10/23 P-6w TaxID=1446905 RepID=A0A451FMF8_9STRA|nr:cytochrome b6-f complex subunit 7 [Eustigmatophyceae sp. Chic 10/23 P-6w]QAA11588.1 cytochrome b6-f complex subunit 7 [Eustigmatophyceae sp. Chic 10/23 P-6w]
MSEIINVGLLGFIVTLIGLSLGFGLLRIQER